MALAHRDSLENFPLAWMLLANEGTSSLVAVRVSRLKIGGWQSPNLDLKSTTTCEARKNCSTAAYPRANPNNWIYITFS